MLDNAFTHIGDWSRAQEIADSLEAPPHPRETGSVCRQYCPIIEHFGLVYHWSLNQCEYGHRCGVPPTGRSSAHLRNLTRTAIHTVKPDNIATFLGRKLHGNYQDEMGNRFNIRIEGTRIKHTMGPVSLKLYDKSGLILRIETTVNDVFLFQALPEGRTSQRHVRNQVASMRKTIYSLPPMAELLTAANRRYLEFLSTIEDPRVGNNNIEKLSRTVRRQPSLHRGFNFFDAEDQLLFETISRGEFNISGFSEQISSPPLISQNLRASLRMLKRLRAHGLIKKIGRTYKYYLTLFGKQVIVNRNETQTSRIIPQLALTSTP